MAEEKKHASDYSFPELVVGVYIFNKKGELMLVRSPKWNNKFVPCGGHVDFNESYADTAIREAKEETGLDVVNPEVIAATDMISHGDFHKGNRHMVSLQCRVELADENQEPKLDGVEAKEYLWLKPEEFLKRDDVVENVREVLSNYLIKIKKGLFGAKKCKECDKNKSEAEENKLSWRRALADYKNLQKETQTRMGEWAKMSEQQILEDFLPVYENFKKAFALHPELQADNEEHKQIKNWTDGIGYIMKQFGDVMKNHNLEEIKTVGEKFDPKYHEAVGEEESAEAKEGTILKEIDGGYKMGDKVIKAAKVIITK